MPTTNQEICVNTVSLLPITYHNISTFPQGKNKQNPPNKQEVHRAEHDDCRYTMESDSAGNPV